MDESVARTKDVRARVSDAEKVAINACAEQMELSTSELLRQGALEKIKRDLNISVGVDDVNDKLDQIRSGAEPAAAPEPFKLWLGNEGGT